MSGKKTENSKRKRSTTYSDVANAKKPQKLRAPNAYNIFSREFFQSDGNCLHSFHSTY